MTRLCRMVSIVALIAAAVAVSISVSGCGGSSKPKYCSDVTDLQKSLGGIDVTGGLSSVKSQLRDIRTETDQLIASARSDFPQQTSDISDALDRLTTSGKAAVSSASASNLAAVASDGKALVSAIDAFHSDTKSKCS